MKRILFCCLSLTGICLSGCTGPFDPLFSGAVKSYAQIHLQTLAE